MEGAYVAEPDVDAQVQPPIDSILTMMMFRFIDNLFLEGSLQPIIS
jgi:hypothetical protein